MNKFFSSSTVEEVLQMVKKSDISSAIVKDFYNELFRIGEPRRRLLRIVSFFPLVGVLFILSASLASVITIENEVIMLIADGLEFLADLVLLLAIVSMIYSAFQLVRLARELT